jgi:hypothetical protein
MAPVTKTAISLRDERYRDIERARKRAGKDRGTWMRCRDYRW